MPPILVRTRRRSHQDVLPGSCCLRPLGTYGLLIGAHIKGASPFRQALAAPTLRAALDLGSASPPCRPNADVSPDGDLVVALSCRIVERLQFVIRYRPLRSPLALGRSAAEARQSHPIDGWVCAPRRPGVPEHVPQNMRPQTPGAWQMCRSGTVSGMRSTGDRRRGPRQRSVPAERIVSARAL